MYIDKAVVGFLLGIFTTVLIEISVLIILYKKLPKMK